METVYFRAANVFQGERPINTLAPPMTAEAQEELAERAAQINEAFGRPTSDSRPSAR